MLVPVLDAILFMLGFLFFMYIASRIYYLLLLLLLYIIIVSTVRIFFTLVAN